MNIEEKDTERSTGKMMDFITVRKFKVYIKQNIVLEVLRKAHSLSILICRLIKKINNVKEDPGRKTDSNFDFSKLPRAYEVLRRRRRNVM